MPRMATCVMCPHTRVNVARVSRAKKEQTAQWNFSEGFLSVFSPSRFSTFAWERPFLLLPLPFLRPQTSVCLASWTISWLTAASVLLAGRTSSFAVPISSYIFLKSSTILHYDFRVTRRQSYPLPCSPCTLFFFLSRSLNFGRERGE